MAIAASVWLAFGQDADLPGDEAQQEEPPSKLDLQFAQLQEQSASSGEPLEARVSRIASWAGENEQWISDQKEVLQARLDGTEGEGLNALQLEAESLEELASQTGEWATSEVGQALREGLRAQAGNLDAKDSAVSEAVAAALAGNPTTLEDRSAAIEAHKEFILNAAASE